MEGETDLKGKGDWGGHERLLLRVCKRPIATASMNISLFFSGKYTSYNLPMCDYLVTVQTLANILCPKLGSTDWWKCPLGQRVIQNSWKRVIPVKGSQKVPVIGLWSPSVGESAECPLPWAAAWESPRTRLTGSWQKKALFRETQYQSEGVGWPREISSFVGKIISLVKSLEKNSITGYR